jgi:hypothetical protein
LANRSTSLHGAVPDAREVGERVLIVNDDMANAVIRSPVGESLPSICSVATADWLDGRRPTVGLRVVKVVICRPALGPNATDGHPNSMP